ncbi:MAG: energy transducer TonB [Deltaproteobacteria bacterium]|jgi:protein TonB|nr:energy transducer TonB [Deltaproteobacteria bacterium]
MSSPPEKDVFLRTLLVSGLIHILALIGVVALGQEVIEPEFVPLAVMDFSDYDPLGGSPGGGGEEESVEPPAPEPEPEPEPEEPEPEPELVESQAEEAPMIAPPKPPEKKPIIKKTPKKQPQRSPGPPIPNAGVAGGGQGGVGGGTGRGNPDLMAAYKSQISRKLNQFKKYPTAAMARNLKGVAKVSFRVTASGRVLGARLVASSGYAVLDEEAMALLKRCSPFPAIPKDLGLSELELNVPISFSVRGLS